MAFLAPALSRSHTSQLIRCNTSTHDCRSNKSRNNLGCIWDAYFDSQDMFPRNWDILISRTLTDKRQGGEDQSPKSEMSNSVESCYPRPEGEAPVLLIPCDIQSLLIDAEFELPKESKPVPSFSYHSSQFASRSVFFVNVNPRPPKEGGNTQNVCDDGLADP